MRGLLFLIAMFIWLNVNGQRVILNVPKLEQERSLWCWAASAEMIDSFHRSTSTMRHRSQCEIVNQYFSLIYDFERELIFRQERRAPFSFGFPRSIACNTYTCDDANYYDNSSGTGNIEMYYKNQPAYFTGVTYHNLLLEMKYYSTMDKKMTFEEIKNDIVNCMPLILGLRTKSKGYHIVVAKGYEVTNSGNVLYVNDPSKCQTCKVEILNFEATSNDSCIESIHYFLAGIRSKDQEMCAPCAKIDKPFTTYEPELVTRILKESFYDSLIIDRSRKKNSAVSIPINQINIDAINFGKLIKLDSNAPLLIQKSTEEYYYEEGRYNVLAKQIIEGKEQIIQVKTCIYPKQDTIYPNGINKEPLYFDWIKDASNIEIIRLSGPLYYEFYRYTRNDKSYIVSANNSQPIKIKNKVFGKEKIISEKQLFCLFKSEFKTSIQGAKLTLPSFKSIK